MSDLFCPSEVGFYDIGENARDMAVSSVLMRSIRRWCPLSLQICEWLLVMTREVLKGSVF